MEEHLKGHLSARLFMDTLYSLVTQNVVPSSISIAWELVRNVNYQAPQRHTELEFLRVGPRNLFCNTLSG